MGIDSGKKFVRIMDREREKEMKIPSKKTIKGKINAYAYKCGFVVVRCDDGSYNLFDIKMNYYVFRGSLEDAVRMIMDELSMIAYNEKNRSLTVGA